VDGEHITFRGLRDTGTGEGDGDEEVEVAGEDDVVNEPNPEILTLRALK
jgi:hypothetical protein